MRSLTNLFDLMIRLMVIDPSSKLFFCSDCFERDGQQRLLEVCVDGVWAQFDRETLFFLVNVSEICDAIPSSEGKRKANANGTRPKTNLFRSDKMTSFLCDAVKGKKISVCEKAVGDAFAAFRVFCPHIVPNFWTVDPIFDSADSSDETKIHDIVLRAKRSLFNPEVIAQRLANAIKPCLDKNHVDLSESILCETGSDARARRTRRVQLGSDASLVNNPRIANEIRSLSA